MRQARSKFKHALRVCKNKKNSIIADKIAEKMSGKNDRDFWREIKNSTNSNVKLPNTVGDVHGSQNIRGMWQEHYSKIFNVVRGSCSKEFLADLCHEHAVFDQGMRVTVNEISEII